MKTSFPRFEVDESILPVEKRNSEIESYAALKSALSALDNATVANIKERLEDVQHAIRRWEEEVHCG